MKKLIVIAIVGMIIVLPYKVFAFYFDRSGIYDEERHSFLFDGESYNAWTRYKDRHDENVIYIYDFNKETIGKFYTADGKIKSLKISPDAQFISFVEQETAKNTLVIMNKKGKIVDRIEGQVQEYVWGKDGKNLYFITGSLRKAVETTEMVPDGVWDYSTTEKKKTKIADKGRYIGKTDFDQHIYFFDGNKTVRFNVDNNMIEDAELEKRFYSPDKRYYYYYLHAEDSNAWDSPYWSPFRIYDSKKNAELSAEKIGFITERNPGDVLWGKDGKTLIFSGRKTRTIPTRELFVYNIETNKLIKNITGALVGINNQKSYLVVFRDSKFVLEKVSY